MDNKNWSETSLPKPGFLILNHPDHNISIISVRFSDELSFMIM